jgi:cyclopropane-fatty-acyl-phospholipid synthase
MPPVLSSSSVKKWLLERILSVCGCPPVRLVLRNGEGVSCPGISPVGTLVIRDRRTLIDLMLHPETGFGEGYARGRIEVEGNLVDMLEAAYRSWPEVRRGWFGTLVSGWTASLRANTPRRSRNNVHQHYDLKTDFYQRWLDPQLVYTCAYFPSDSTSLEEAQTAKLDYVCRKVGLRRGETVVEAGCGWGALALHMAKHYGARVKAFNLSHEQTVFARQRARQEGLSDRVDFIEDDYRNISGQFDVFMSVGMLEHVGISQYAELGRVIHRSIGSSGRGLLHFIGRNHPAPLSPWITKRIFPGAYAPTLQEAIKLLEPWSFSVCDVENLRLHYARTLEHWLDRFERSARQLTAMFDSEFVRAWRLYLAGSLVAFRVGTLQLFQVTFAGPRCERIPWTRAHLYATAEQQRQEPKWIPTMS